MPRESLEDKALSILVKTDEDVLTVAEFGQVLRDNHVNLGNKKLKALIATLFNTNKIEIGRPEGGGDALLIRLPRDID